MYYTTGLAAQVSVLILHTLVRSLSNVIIKWLEKEVVRRVVLVDSLLFVLGSWLLFLFLPLLDLLLTVRNTGGGPKSCACALHMLAANLASKSLSLREL